MSSNLTLDLDNNQRCSMMMTETDFSIDQGGEWDISLFDELDSLGVADDLFKVLGNADYICGGPDLNFDIPIPAWTESDYSSTACTDSEVSVHSLSPAHTLSSASSPTAAEAPSPYSLHDEAWSPQSQPSPVSVCSESSGFSELSPPAKKAPKRTSQTARAKPAPSSNRPIQMSTKVSIQPKPVIAAVPLAHAAAPLQPKTIILQPLQTTMLPVVKAAPISIQPAPSPGQPIMLSQSSQLLHINTSQGVTGGVVAMPTLSQDMTVVAPPVASLRSPSSDDDSKFSQRQQRMIKNRESASLSRKKKKEYLLTLEERLKMALSENAALKSENGNLKRQLEGLRNENSLLKATAPKRRAVCLMAVLLFLALNVGPISQLQGNSGSGLELVPAQHSRHLLGFSDGEGPEPVEKAAAETTDSAEGKALMVVKELNFLRSRPPPSCLPPVNRTKCLELAHELRGWVNRHDLQLTKSRRMSNSHLRPSRSILKSEHKDAENSQIVTVPYAEAAKEKTPGSELQVYYRPSHTYGDFFAEINRRGDTFYVVSFRRDHLLLPATSHNKGSRPKMSVVLPAMNVNDSVIGDKEFEVMMQIDCEVTDTRILHIRSATIPPMLRVNRTQTFYQQEAQPAPPMDLMIPGGEKWIGQKYLHAAHKKNKKQRVSSFDV
ncbi:cyclic AMP-dependent transcription factor ATF-6 alpha isoform X2 [Syngnathus typhle]|uniref:cyclic AMP-dependent transcription factor ATF-6 alpha isoform X2 n=1 Tax=Syngnathus typhle TaxID=161592 RepID=UPI002A6A959D|nr:cyclic AMP-dependent transcription factor ATF-6 alpha isoform X2 [Syngnathus typhle]XP_061154248.1 cyclic AMP-dependent transcription factor ATF-6 alpha isoform X2 [Syngnathus typhle]XP_061154249.1 cyclic AMP-dependent transcription factor ATF-6 alpha isoform X2 [Syngnathus typhle]